MMKRQAKTERKHLQTTHQTKDLYVDMQNIKSNITTQQ